MGKQPGMSPGHLGRDAERACKRQTRAVVAVDENPECCLVILQRIRAKQLAVALAFRLLRGHQSSDPSNGHFCGIATHGYDVSPKRTHPS